jgi:ATP-dependent exoDNAse (exonuclease V) beta subunit
MTKGKNWKEGHKYWGLTPEQIKEQWSQNAQTVSSAGTEMHYRIECFMNNPNCYTHKELYEDYKIKNDNIKNDKTNESLEWNYFIDFVKNTPHLKPYRTEWTIYHEELKLAGSIDMVYENSDGTLSIYDWKRVKDIKKINLWNKYATTLCICHFPDTNFWHYALQLNTYKSILEDKYEKKVKELFLVRLHPDAEEKSYELIEIPNLKKEMMELFLERKNKIQMQNT